MKTFLPHRSETMTVAELTARLAKFPADMPVVACWEGQMMPVTLDADDEENICQKTGELTEDVLVLDVE